MSCIHLSNGGHTLIDQSDLDYLDQWTWRRDDDGYAVRGSTNTTIKMHQQLLGPPPPGMVTDHINTDRLDNRRSNLRFATHRLNHLNTKRLTGVFCDRGYWRVRFELGDGKTVSISGIKDEAEARSIAILLKGALIYHELTKGTQSGLGQCHS